jgi:translation initiation factor 3 subunit B
MSPSQVDSPQANGFVLDENGELDFSDLEQKYAISWEEGFENLIVVDNCPLVEEGGRKTKLLAFIRKIFATNGHIAENGIFMPMANDPETDKVTSQGYIFQERRD